MLLEANNPEAIAKGEWKIPFNFDPLNNNIKIWQVAGQRYYFAMNGISPEVSFSSPFLGTTPSLYTEFDGCAGISMDVPENLLRDEYKGINYGLAISFKNGQTSINYNGSNISYSEKILFNVAGKLPERYPVNSEVVFIIGTLEGGKNIDYSNILRIDDKFIFMRQL